MTYQAAKDLEKIEKYLRPFYDIESIEYAGVREIRKIKLNTFYCYIRHEKAGVVTEHLVFLYRNAVDMLSRTAQVKEFGEVEDPNFITIGDKPATIDIIYKNGDRINDSSILKYGDYVSLREHIFENGQPLECVQWLRRDTEERSMDWGRYGRYVITGIYCN